MNDSIKRKVNGIGLAGKIVSIVLIVLMGLGCVGLVIAGAVCGAIPKEALALGVKADFDVTVSDRFISNSGSEAVTERMIEKANEELRSRLPEDAGSVDIELEKTDGGVVAHGSTDRMTFGLTDLKPVILGALLRCVCLIVIFVFLLRLAEAFRTCDSPFEERIVRRMMTFAWVLLGAAVVMGLSFSGTVSITGPGIVSHTGSVSYSMNFAPVLIALVVLFLSLIFRYGAKLQQESDETL